MSYSMTKELSKANYNSAAGNQGWSIGFCTGFIENHNLTKTQIYEIHNNCIPALEVFDNITNKMKQEKIQLEETINKKIIAFKNENITITSNTIEQNSYDNLNYQTQISEGRSR